MILGFGDLAHRVVVAVRVSAVTLARGLRATLLFGRYAVSLPYLVFIGMVAMEE